MATLTARRIQPTTSADRGKGNGHSPLTKRRMYLFAFLFELCATVSTCLHYSNTVAVNKQAKTGMTAHSNRVDKASRCKWRTRGGQQQMKSASHHTFSDSARSLRDARQYDQVTLRHKTHLEQLKGDAVRREDGLAGAHERAKQFRCENNTATHIEAGSMHDVE